MSQHEEWGSRISRGMFRDGDWAKAVKRDIAICVAADAALTKEVSDNEGDDPMSDEYKRLHAERSVAASNVSRHLNHDVLVEIANFVLITLDEDKCDDDKGCGENPCICRSR